MEWGDDPPVVVAAASKQPTPPLSQRTYRPTTRDVWETGRRVDWFTPLDDRRLHIRHKVYCLSKEPLIEKTVITSASRYLSRPWKGSIVLVAHDSIPPVEEEAFFSDPHRPLTHRCEIDLGKLESDRCGITPIIISMAPGERCMIRRTVPETSVLPETSSVTTSTSQYLLEVYHCLRIWRRQELSESPPLVLDISSTGLPTVLLRDCTAVLHFELYKRTTGQPMDMDSTNGTWTLVHNTRINDSPIRFLLGMGRQIPCVEMMMAALPGVSTGSRLFATCEFVFGPYTPEVLARPEFEELDVDVDYYTNQLQLAPGYDLLFQGVQVVSIVPPSYEGENKVPMLHQLGNDLVGQRMYRRAVLRYMDCLRAMGVDDLRPGLPHRIKQRAISIVLNIALCYMNDEEPKWVTALEGINQVLRIDPQNVKALSRKARCLRYRNGETDLEAALECITLAATLEPKDRMIRDERLLIKDLVNERRCPFDGLRNRTTGLFPPHEASTTMSSHAGKVEASFPFFRQYVMEQDVNRINH